MNFSIICQSHLSRFSIDFSVRIFSSRINAGNDFHRSLLCFTDAALSQIKSDKKTADFSPTIVKIFMNDYTSIILMQPKTCYHSNHETPMDSVVICGPFY